MNVKEDFPALKKYQWPDLVRDQVYYVEGTHGRRYGMKICVAGVLVFYWLDTGGYPEKPNEYTYYPCHATLVVS